MLVLLDQVTEEGAKKGGEAGGERSWGRHLVLYPLRKGMLLDITLNACCLTLSHQTWRATFAPTRRWHPA